MHSASSLFFNDPATTAIYTLSLHDALPIFERNAKSAAPSLKKLTESKERLGRLHAIWTLEGLGALDEQLVLGGLSDEQPDRKSTRLNSSHLGISYAVFCLKKKKNRVIHT